MKKFLLMFLLCVGLVSAATDYCCEKTLEGEYCVDTDYSDCDLSYQFLGVPCSETTFCERSCCVTEAGCYSGIREGRCIYSLGGDSEPGDCDIYQGIIPECTMGCCNINGMDCSETNQLKCTEQGNLSGGNYTFYMGMSENQCLSMCEIEDVKGCCVDESGYFYTSRGLCLGEFNEGQYCSSISGSGCTARFNKGCDNGDVIWYDSCGNYEGIAEDCDLGQATTCGCDYSYYASDCNSYDLKCKFLGCDTLEGNKSFNQTWCDIMPEDNDPRVFEPERFMWHKFTTSLESSGTCTSEDGMENLVKSIPGNLAGGTFIDNIGDVVLEVVDWVLYTPIFVGWRFVLEPVFDSILGCGTTTICHDILQPIIPDYSFIGGEGICNFGECSDMGLFITCDTQSPPGGLCEWEPNAEFAATSDDGDKGGTPAYLNIKADSDLKWFGIFKGETCDNSRTKFTAQAYFDLVDGVGFISVPDKEGYEFGDRHFVKTCSYGEEVLLEACDEDRGEVCIDGACMRNDYKSCNNCGINCTQEQCEALGDCELIPMWYGCHGRDCDEEWASGKIDYASDKWFGKLTCVPKYPPGTGNTCGNCYDEDYDEDTAKGFHYLPLPYPEFWESESDLPYIDCPGCVEQWQCGNQECSREGDCYWTFEFPVNTDEEIEAAEENDLPLVKYAHTYCLPIEPPEFGNCSVCNGNDLRPCSKYTCEALGKNCNFDREINFCYSNGSNYTIAPVELKVGEFFEKPCTDKWYCSPWSTCGSVYDTRTRTCIEINGCNVISNKPDPFESQACSQTLECEDKDGDGYGRNCFEELSGTLIDKQKDCNDEAFNINPSAMEVCDGIDNDCDNAIDETCACVQGDSRNCGVTTGTCNQGIQFCVNGVWSICGGNSYTSITEEICDEIDNDCDGQVDEVCACLDGATQQCGSDKGVCTKGTQTCVDGNWTICEGGFDGNAEICTNTLDDDCDGLIDSLDDNCQVTTELCYDHIQNGNEEGVDCGGSCTSCSIIKDPTCDDFIRNQGEDQVDCGGPCDPCEDIVYVEGEMDEEEEIVYEEEGDSDEGSNFPWFWLILFLIILLVLAGGYYLYRSRNLKNKKSPEPVKNLERKVLVSKPPAPKKEIITTQKPKKQFKSELDERLEKSFEEAKKL